jgi:glycosyltransferase involved in cell wall biosynthesis
VPPFNRSFRAVISLIIPTLDDEIRLVPTLSALVPGAADGLIVEAIIADGGSKDDTEKVADVAGCRLMVSDRPEGERLAAAIATAKSNWLLIMAPGVSLSEGWINEVRRFIAVTTRQEALDRRAAIFSYRREDHGASARADEWLALLAFQLGFGPRPSQGLLIPAKFYRAIGGGPSDRRTQRDLAKAVGRSRITVLNAAAISIEELP